MSAISAVLSAIPAPGSGPHPWGREYRLYGLAIAAGVIAGLELIRRRWAERGGDPEDMSALALWVVPSALIGARLYHVITDNQIYRGHWFDLPNPFDPNLNSPLAIWKGGLGIPGGLLFGMLAGLWAAKRRGMRLGPAVDAVAPAVPLGQAIGRLGNYFNQELYGGPSTLPWAVYIDPNFRTAYPEFETFQPTFLYEGLWNIGLMFALLTIDKRWPLRPGRLFVLYFGGYFLGRLWVEALRSDTANTIAGLRVNTWTSLIVIALVAVVLIKGGIRRRPDDNYEPYVDGHRYDPDLALVPAGAATGTAAEVAVPAGGSAPAPPDAASTEAEPEAEGPATAVAVADPEDEAADEPVAAEPEPEPERAPESAPEPEPGDQRTIGGADEKPDAEP
jgi:prolipoprotein diacylglyceryl transferase